MLACNAAHLELSDLLAALRAARPERQPLVPGQVVPAGHGAPVVRRVLPEAASPAGALRFLAAVSPFDAGAAVDAIVLVAVVQLQVAVIAHPPAGDVMVRPRALVAVDI